jgi:hypothetical protein
METTQLTDPLTYNPKASLLFRKPIESSLPGANGAPSVNYKRVPIGTRNPDGSKGDLVLQTLRLYSFGLSQNLSQTTGKVEGYTLPLCLTNRNDPTPEEKKWVSTFNDIVECTKDHLVDKRDDIGQYTLERVELKKLNPIWYKTEKGRVVDGAAPILYAKLMMNKKTGSIATIFVNGATGEEMDPMVLLGKPCYVEAAVKIESVYIGAKISLQVKLQEVNVFLIDNTPKRLLRRPVAVEQVEMVDDDDDHSSTAASATASSTVDDDMGGDADDGSIKGDDDDDDSPAVKEEPVKPVASTPAVSAPAARRPLKKK